MRNTGGGNILLIGSVGTFVSWDNETPYAIAKAGLSAMARGIALENAAYKIRANVLCPGLIAAPMLESLIISQKPPDEYLDKLLKDIPMGRLGEINEVVDAAVFLTSKSASYITGTTLLVDGGYCAR
jgi:NAD(P)-dependent dehydrogenase (short-subunit alcohol dehydrogenase family)